VVEIFEVGQGGCAIAIFEKHNFENLNTSLDCIRETAIKHHLSNLISYNVRSNLGLHLLPIFYESDITKMIIHEQTIEEEDPNLSLQCSKTIVLQDLVKWLRGCSPNQTNSKNFEVTFFEYCYFTTSLAYFKNFYHRFGLYLKKDIKLPYRKSI